MNSWPAFAECGHRVGPFRVAHVLPRRVRLRSALLRSPAFDGAYFQALLEVIPGVEAVRVNLQGGSVVIEFDGSAETWERIAELLAIIPKVASMGEEGTEEPVTAMEVAARAGVTFLVAAVPRPARAMLSCALSLGTILEGVETFFRRGIKIQVLDAAAVLLSLVRGHYFTAGVITTLLALGRYLEGHTERRTASLLKGLLRPHASSLWVLRDGVETCVPESEVAVGELVIFGPGELVAVDGVVRDGEASVNQSSISGESVAVHIQPGDRVISGAVVEEGRLIVEVERIGAETSLARIGRFIDQSLRSKSKTQTKSSELADSLVPVTLGLGTLVFLITRDTARSASVLTVDFSCAVKLASPVAIRSGIYAAAQSGVLLKGAAALDALQDVDTIVFDKTGTLTTGCLAVTDVVPLGSTDEKELLALAAGAEEHYDHPVARAVVREAQWRGLTLPPISRVDFIVAHGVSAYINGVNVLVGSYHFIAEDEKVPCAAIDETARTLRSQGKSLLYVARGGALAGIIALRDDPREEAGAVLEALKQRGISRIVVLTGDHRDTALALQKALPQIDDIRYELRPEDKAAVVEELKNSGRFVAFVGDGVNDAPALVSAHVGFCMPKGADLAKEVAQVLLLKEDLRTLLVARDVAMRTGSIIRRCFVSTISCNTLTMLLAAMGLPPIGSALLHNASTIGILGYAATAASHPQ